MKPVERSITLLLAFVALVQACTSDKGVVGPRASTRLTADGAEEQPQYGSWSAPVNLGPVINTAANEQHPAISKDGLSLYISSDHQGGFDGTDIWVLQRACTDADDAACAWQTTANLGSNINSAGNDLAPTFTPDGHQLYFHSTGRGGCGLADIFLGRRHDKRDDFGWERSEEHTSELQSQSNLVCRLLLEKKKKRTKSSHHEVASAAQTELYTPPTIHSS